MENKKYTKLTRYNLVLSLEQYKVLMARKKHAKENNKRVRYTDLVKEWGIKQHHMSSAVFRGIKQYDYIIWKEQQNDNRQRIRAGSMAEGNRSRALEVQTNLY